MSKKICILSMSMKIAHQKFDKKSENRKRERNSIFSFFFIETIEKSITAKLARIKKPTHPNRREKLDTIGVVALETLSIEDTQGINKAIKQRSIHIKQSFHPVLI